MKHEVTQGYAELLARYEWHEFITCTFRLTQRDTNRAVAMFEAWVRRRILDHAVKVGDAWRGRNKAGRTKYYGPQVNRWNRGRDKPVYVIGVEQHAEGGNHLHAILRHDIYAQDIRRDSAWKTWYKEMNLGFIRIEPPKSQSDIRSYVSKYVAKSGELFFSDSFKGAKTDHFHSGVIRNAPKTLTKPATDDNTRWRHSSHRPGLL